MRCSELGVFKSKRTLGSLPLPLSTSPLTMSRARTISIDSARRPESASGQSLHASDTDSLIAKPFSTEPAITSTSAPADANVTWSGDQYVAPSSGTAATVGYADGAAPLGRSSSILRNRLPQVSTLGLPSRASSIYSPVEGPNRGPRNIVLLLDGTGQEFSPHNSNIIKLMSVLKADEQQSLYYSSGLGTLAAQVVTSLTTHRHRAAHQYGLVGGC